MIRGHFMFHPEWEAGCPSCSVRADEIADGPAPPPSST